SGSGSGASLQAEVITAGGGPLVFAAQPDPTLTSTSYAVRVMINPRNVKRRLKPYAVFGYSLLTYAPDPTLQHQENGETRGRPIVIGGGIRMRLMPPLAARGEATDESDPG